MYLLQRLVPLILFALISCGPLISPYSTEAYKTATTLKAESLALLRKSGEPYANHAEDIETLSVKVDAAYEFAKGLPLNDAATQAWAAMRDPQAGLLAGYFVEWQEDVRVNDFKRDQAIELIGIGFDKIICIESTKKSITDCNRIGQEGLGG